MTGINVLYETSYDSEIKERLIDVVGSGNLQVYSTRIHEFRA